MPLDPRKSATKYNFGLNGMVSKESPTLLTDGQYRSCVNMEVVQEGALATRSGKKALGTVGAGHPECYMVRKMVVAPTEAPAVPSTNPRYLGVIEGSCDLIRTLDYNSGATVATGINTNYASAYRKAFSLATYSAGETGGPWAFIASELKMLKDRGIGLYGSLANWGIRPAYGVATAVASGVGNLNSTANGSTNYDYRFTFQAADTNNEGNPSQTMLAGSSVVNGSPAAANLQQMTVTGYYSNDPQIDTVNIYRRGGILYDAWRFVGSVPNVTAGAPGTTFSFIDNVADTDLVYARLLSTDNDPPVTSTVTNPSTAGGILNGAGAAAGYTTVTLASGSVSSLTPGTQVNVIWDFPETVTVVSVGVGGSTFTAYFQFAQPAGTTVFADAICNQPCNLAIAYQQFILVAGDPNNPHLIYRSIGDSPEYFPVAPADGSAATASAGTPSNPIMQMYEYRGQILTLNLYAIFESMIYSGSLVPPAKMADKGTVGMRANCKTDVEVWFLATDGVWSWDGAQCRKRSEAIDPIFHGESINGFQPINFAHASQCVMEFYRGEIHILYIDTNGVPWELVCEPGYGDRWSIRQNTGSVVNFLFTEPDTGNMIEADYGVVSGMPFAMVNQYQLAVVGGFSTKNFTADYFTGAGFSGSWAPPSGTNGGIPIPFDMRLPWFDQGAPALMKVFEEVLLEIDTSNMLNGVDGAVALTVELLLDFADTPGQIFAADPLAVDTFTILVNDSRGRAIVSLLPNLATVGGHVQAYGREARAISYHIYGTAWPAQAMFYSLTLCAQPTEMLTAGGGSDWSDLGYKHDKKLYQMIVEFDTAGVNRTLVLDTMTGRDGNTFNAAVQSFSLVNAVHTGAGRAKKSFPIAEGIVVKLARVRPYSTDAIATGAAVFFKIFSVEFEKEEYPPDIVSFTPWEDDGYPFLKYVNQATLAVNTNGVPVLVQIQADGAIVANETITSTDNDRDRNLTLPTGLTGKRWRIYVDPTQAALVSGAGMFQLWNSGKIFRFQPADKGEVGHTFDWDDLGHQYDKLLETVVFEYDTTAGGPITLQMDTISGIKGATYTASVATFTLGTGRGKTEFPLPPDMIVKMVRVYPATVPNVGYKQWKYAFQKTDYPPDIVHVTPWKDASSPDDKEPSWLFIDADTAGAPATVILQNENGTALTVQHTGTVTNRKKNYPMPVDTHAKMWRVTATESATGKFQLFDWNFQRWQPFPQAGPVDPPEIVLFTPWNDFDYPYPKLCRNLILTINTGSVPCAVAMQTSDGGIKQTFPVTASYTNRRLVLAANPELDGLLWRLLLTPGSGGLAQLWDWSMETIKEPPAVTQWTSYQQSFGYVGSKILVQLWLEYKSAVSINVTFVSSTGTFSVLLPAHATRAVERVLFPSTFGAGLNKSVLYDISIASSDNATPFSLYADASRIEFVEQGAERHAGYQKKMVSSFMTIPI